jgi:glycosyltransferase involved in cell wall biosynthesis
MDSRPRLIGISPVAKLKKLVIVVPSFEMGGAERQALNLAKYIHQNKLAYVEIWSLGPGRIVADEAKRLGIPTALFSFNPWLSKWKVGLQVLGFALQLFIRKVDYLLPYVMYPNLLCCAASKIGGVKRCFWQQRDEGRDRGPAYLEKIALRFADGFISNSSAGMSFLAATLGVAQDRCRLIRNGVEVLKPQVPRYDWRVQHGFDEGRILVSMVANITSAKDHFTLLKGWRLVVDSIAPENLEPILLLAGSEGDAVSDVRKAIDDFGLGHTVHLLGQIQDVASHLNAIDLFVFSSQKEGCPNAVLEAMGAGLAVVASNIDGTRDALGGDYGFLFEPGNEQECGMMITTLLSSPAERGRLGAINRRRVETLFSTEKMCRETINAILGNAASL